MNNTTKKYPNINIQNILKVFFYFFVRILHFKKNFLILKPIQIKFKLLWKKIFKYST